MKKTLAIVCLVFTLSACGGTDTPTGLVSHEAADFSIAIPQNWVVFGSGSTALPKPKSGEIALAVSATETALGFANNLLILKDKLAKDTPSDRFTMLNHVGVTEEYSEYESIAEKDFTFTDGEASKLYNFTARYNSKTPKLTFLQTGRVCDGNIGFFLTIALPANITDVAKYEEILKTFACQ